MRVLLLTAFSAVFVLGQDDARWHDLTSEGLRLSKVPNYPVAEVRFRAALEEAEKWGEADHRLWLSLSNLALMRENQGDLVEAEKLSRRALELREKYLGPEHAELAAVLHNLAGVYIYQARYSEADPLLRRALLIAEHSGDERQVATILNSLGLNLMNSGQRARAEPVLRRSLALFERLDDGESVDVGKVVNNLSMLYRFDGKPGKAETELKRALPIFEKNLGPGHPQVASTLNNLFTVIAEQHRHDEAEPYLRRALAIGEEACPDSMITTQIRANLASFLAARGRFQEAAQILEDVIARQERLYGPRHPLLANSLANSSVVLGRLHHKAEAKRAENRANSIIKSFR